MLTTSNKGVIIKMENNTPDFAILQNSKTRTSAIWTKELGKWHECNEQEYEAVNLVSTVLRKSPYPEETMKQIIAMMQLKS